MKRILLILKIEFDLIENESKNKLNLKKDIEISTRIKFHYPKPKKDVIMRLKKIKMKISYFQDQKK